MKKLIFFSIVSIYLLICLICWVGGYSNNSEKEKPYRELYSATIKGVYVAPGLKANDIQSKLAADKFEMSGTNYGDESYGYYIVGGVTYKITYCAPGKDYSEYIVKKIESNQ